LVQREGTGPVRENDLRQRGVRERLVIEVRIEAAEIRVRRQGSLPLRQPAPVKILGDGEDVELIARLTVAHREAGVVVVPLAALAEVTAELPAVRASLRDDVDHAGHGVRT